MSNLSGTNAILKCEGQAGISKSFNVVPSDHMIIKLSTRSLMASLLQSTEVIEMHLACCSLLSVLCIILPQSLPGNWYSCLPKPVAFHWGKN